MQERYWQQLKSQMCPKNQWSPDQSTNKCFCCGKEFKFLIRRKHHCRFCGRIFCSDCSNFFINGNYIGINDEKFVRNCEFCHQRIQKFIRDYSKYPQTSKSEHKSKGENSDDDQDVSFIENNIFADNQLINSTQISARIQIQIKQLLKAASQYLCAEFQINSQVWSQRLADIALRAALEVRMDVMIQNQSQNAMDIAKKVRIRTITTPQDQISCILFKGITIQKNFSTKNMPKHLNHPKIIVVAGSIDTDSVASFIKFEQIVKNQKQIMKRLLDKLFIRLQPDVVFVENSVSITALQYFKQKRIVVVSKLKPKDIQAIMCVAKIKKKIKEIWMLDRYKTHNIIGVCDKVYFKTIRQQQSLMFIQGDIGIRTIILGDSTDDQHSTLKKCIQNLLRFARQMQLEKYIIDTDLQMLSILMKKPSRIDYPFIQFFTPFMERNIQSCLSRLSINTHITYSHIKFLNAPKNYIQYAEHQNKTSMRQVCGKVQFEKKKIYTNSDITLGSYILLTVANSEKTCKRCEYIHCQSFYMHDLEIKVQVERKQAMKQSYMIEDLGDNEALTFEKLRFFLLKQKQLVIIETYLQCLLCKTNVLNQTFKIGRNYLQNSLYNFLENASQFYLAQHEKLDTSKKKKFRKMSIEQCPHDYLARVFQYNNALVKFSIEKTFQYKMNHIDITANESQQDIAHYDDTFTKNLYHIQLTQKKQLYAKLSTILSTIPFPCNNNNVVISTKAMYHYPQFIKTKQILQASKSELKAVQARSQKYLETSGHDWTIFMRQIYKIQAIYRMVIDLINEFEQILKKQKIQQISPSINKQTFQRHKSQGINTMIVEKTVSMAGGKKQIFQITTNQEKQREKLYLTNPNSKQQISRKDSEDTTVSTFYQCLTKRRYPRNQGSYLYFTPIYTTDAVSIIAAGLNSAELKKHLSSQTPIPNELKLRIPFNRKLKTSWDLKNQLQTVYKQVFPQMSQKEAKSDVFQLTIFYYNQFEQLRQREGIPLSLYIRSLCGCRNWDSSGGKSNSKFAKSHNQLLVVKIINAKEFVEFQRFCPSYLQYIRQSKERKEQSYIGEFMEFIKSRQKLNILNALLCKIFFLG